MKRPTGLASAILVVLAVSAPAARGTLLASCCACVPSHKAEGGSTAGILAEQAFFCAEAASGDEPALEQRCDAFPDAILTCEPNIPGPSCQDQLLETGIRCPTAGAPLLAPLGLGTLALLLGALGAAALTGRRVLRRARLG